MVCGRLGSVSQASAWRGPWTLEAPAQALGLSSHTLPGWPAPVSRPDALPAAPRRAGVPADTGTCSLASPQEARDDAKVTCLTRAGHSALQWLPPRYHWKCTPASSPGRACFAGPPPRSLRAGAPTLSFAADSLSRSYDQFLVTLVVSSEDRNSSEAQVFLSTRLDSALRYRPSRGPHGAGAGVCRWLSAPRCCCGLQGTRCARARSRWGL